MFRDQKDEEIQQQTKKAPMRREDRQKSLVSQKPSEDGIQRKREGLAASNVEDKLAKRTSENWALGWVTRRPLGTLTGAVLMQRMRAQNLTGVGLNKIIRGVRAKTKQNIIKF